MFMVRWACLMFLLGVWLHISESVTPDDEDDSSDSILHKFLVNLEQRTGFNKNYSITTSCSKQPCIVNYNGDIVWEIREKLYSDNMKDSFNDTNARITTLDGCLDEYKNSTNEYRSCMETVRSRMNSFLEDTFEVLFIEKLQENCDLANCLSL